MIKKAWCKTAQIVLDHLHDGCIFHVCIHSSHAYDRHGYVWHSERGKAILTVQDTILTRLVNDGFIVETQRCQCAEYCRNHFGEQVSSVWKVTYRAAGEEEDYRVHAQHNKEREALYDMLLAVGEHQQVLLDIPMRSQDVNTIVQLLSEVSTNAVAVLADNPSQASEQ